jgi:nucleotide-binding universal stress UspA family protein
MIPTQILFCTDFSDNSGPAQQLSMEYAQAFNAELLVLHVINSGQFGYPSLEEGVPRDIWTALEHIQSSVDKALAIIAEDCQRNVPRVSTHTRIGTPAYEIVRFADEQGAGLIVLGTHGWTGIKKLIMGSTAENVVRTATSPVMTVKASRELHPSREQKD